MIRLESTLVILLVTTLILISSNSLVTSVFSLEDLSQSIVHDIGNI